MSVVGLRRLSRNIGKYIRYRSTEAAKSNYETPKQQQQTTMDLKDIENHTSLKDNWWSLDGGVGALHPFNKLRVPLVRDGLANAGLRGVSRARPLDGVRLLDVGCGGGILAEPLARIGASVTGLDASPQLIALAREHAKLDPSLEERLSYVATSIEEHSAANPAAYDAVVASEILEHVAEPELFLKCCVETLKPGGSIFITTPNKTMGSWLGGIVVAEYLWGFVPKGTHDWNKFLPPEETQRLLEKCGCDVKLLHGMMYNPLNKSWSWCSSTAFCYSIHAVKRFK